MLMKSESATAANSLPMQIRPSCPDVRCPAWSAHAAPPATRPDVALARIHLHLRLP